MSSFSSSFHFCTFFYREVYSTTNVRICICCTETNGLINENDGLRKIWKNRGLCKKLHHRLPEGAERNGIFIEYLVFELKFK